MTIAVKIKTLAASLCAVLCASLSGQALLAAPAVAQTARPDIRETSEEMPEEMPHDFFVERVESESLLDALFGDPRGPSAERSRPGAAYERPARPSRPPPSERPTMERAGDPFIALAPYGDVVILNAEPVWRPSVGFDWRPFTDGAWDFAPGRGWIWTGLEPWSGVTDHQGRWIETLDLGWVWRPPAAPTRRGPAQVAWRLGAGLIGWAPASADGDADPRHFVFVPLEGLIRPGETARLTRAQSRAAYRQTRAVAREEAASLSPARLSARLQADSADLDRRAARNEAARRNAARTRGLDAPDPGGRLTSRAPQGRFATAPVDETVAAPPLRTAPPPLPGPRPQRRAALTEDAPSPTPDSPAPEASSPTPEALTAPSQTSRDAIEAPSRTVRSSDAVRGAVEAEASRGDTAAGPSRESAATAASGTRSAPRTVGPAWLSNGDCSARGIREGRCRTE